MLNEESNKKKRLSEIIAAIVVIATLVAALYCLIITIQHAEFNALDQSLVWETVAVDKTAE